MTLFEIDERIRECVDPETGEIIDGMLLDSLLMDREQKIEGVALWCKELAYEADALRKEKQTIDARVKACENKIAGIKNWLAFATGGEKFSTPKAVVSFRNTSAVVIDDADKIPERFIKTEVVKTPMKVELKKALANGAVEGCHLQDNISVIIK